jgi:O-antigen ligase
VTTPSIVRQRPHLSPAGSETEHASSHWLRTAVCYSAIAIILFGPIAFGAVEPWAMFIVHAGAVVVFLLWLASVMIGPKPQIEFQLIHIPPIIFAAIVVYQIAWARSGYRHETATEFMNYIAYGLIFLIATDIFRKEREVRSLVLSLAVLGFLLAVVGSIQEFTADGKLYWIRMPQNPAGTFGPYVNRNHYAGVVEMLFPFALLGALKPNLENSKRIVLGFAALLMVATVFLCGSRGGFISVALQMVFLAVLVMWRSRHAGIILTLALAFILTGAFGTWLGSDRLIGRLGDLKNTAGFSRLQVAKDSVQMFEQRPWTGWGLGTFPVVYPKFRTFATDLYVNEAHNDFVQLLVETGIVGFAAGIFLLVVVFRRGFNQLRDADYGTWRTAAVAASLAGVVGITVHSLFDFNLQIPANALLFYVLCAVAGSLSGQQAEIIRRVERGGSASVIDL